MTTYYNVTKIGVIGLALLFSIPTIQRCYRMNIFAENSIDGVTLYGNRLEKIKANLPSNGTVGYATKESTKSGGSEFYFQTEYFFAPLIVDKSLNNDLIIGNFDDDETALKFAMDNNLNVYQDLGDGLVLLSRQRK